MTDHEPVNIMGVFAFPNPDRENRMIRFIDSEYNTLFTVKDGERIVLTNLDNQTEILTCTYVDDCHAKIGSNTFHIRQFAEIQESYGIRYMPCEPKPEDTVDTYEIYRAVIGNAGGGVRSFEEAKKTLRAKNYSRVYAGMYAKGNSLEHLVEKHRGYDPSSYLVRPMSVGIVVVLTRGGKKNAYYADVDGFHEIPEFLTQQPQRVRNRRKNRGESR